MRICGARANKELRYLHLLKVSVVLWDAFEGLEWPVANMRYHIMLIDLTDTNDPVPNLKKQLPKNATRQLRVRLRRSAPQPTRSSVLRCDARLANSFTV
jgi:hypothetical protein